jgi:hypothetical protein
METENADFRRYCIFDIPKKLNLRRLWYQYSELCILHTQSTQASQHDANVLIMLHYSLPVM